MTAAAGGCFEFQTLLLLQLASTAKAPGYLLPAFLTAQQIQDLEGRVLPGTLLVAAVMEVVTVKEVQLAVKAGLRTVLLQQ